MKNIFWKGLLVAGALLLVNQSASAQKFEGTLTWKVVSAQMGDQDQHDMVMNIKGNKFEIDMDAGMQGMLHIYPDRVNRKVTIVMEQQKMGVVRDLPNDSVEEVSAKMKNVELKATGQKSIINGHNAELYVLTSPQETVSMWMSKDFGHDVAEGLRAAMMNNNKGSAAQKKAFRDLAEKGYFPVKIESKDGGSMELASVEAKSIPDSKFMVPADVTIMPMTGMGRPGMHGSMPQGGTPQGAAPQGGVPQGGMPQGGMHGNMPQGNEH